ncbi:MAG: MobC family plasmid mobilization relaxosome protein [Pseudoalteromonas sp.]|uniref:MobC family plasmid mobilization relaxosome protein n=1 Tax=Pseudoalteromonas sp. TaxID=53249 RepID=UPI00305726AA
MKRIKSIKVWLTPEEHEQLLELKSGSQLATWIRETCLGKKSKRRTKPPTVDPLLLRHLAAIGNNVNQIARQCNSSLSPTDTMDVIVRLDAIEKALIQIRSDHDIQNS